MSDVLLNGLTGSLSGILSGLLLYPLESIRTNIQTSKQAISTIKFIKDKLKNEGLIDVYAGLNAFLVRSVANNGFYYLI